MLSKIKELFQKKRLFLFSLVFIILAASLPLKTAKALELPDVFGFIKEGVKNTILGTVYFVVYQIAHIVLIIAGYLVKLGAYLVDAMLNPEIYAQVLDINNPSSAVMTGWTVIRDMGNIFFVLLLLIIAFSTILRIQQYNARTLLPKFIIVLFLMNFSAVFAGIVIDFGQVFMYEIRNWMGQFSGDTGSMGSLTSFVDSDFIRNFGFSPRGGGGYSLENAVGVSFAAIFVLLLGACYIMLAGFLLIRLIAFAILIILSPAAILGLVMPGLRSISSEWWQKLWQYSLFGPLFIFFVYLAGTMATSLKDYDPSVFDPNLNEEELGGISYLVTLVVPYAVSLGMLYAVIPITQRLGIAGASMLIGGTMGFGKVLGAAYSGAKIPFIAGKKLAKEADKRTGGRTSDWLGKQKEKVLKNLPFGIGQVLKDKAKAEKDKEENMKIIRIEFGEAKNRDLDLLHEKARGKLATKEDRALFAETAAAQGKLGDARYAGDIKDWMPEIERTLSQKDLGEITNKNLNLATETSESRARIKGSDTTGMDSETKTKFASASEDQKKEMVREQIMKEKMADIIRDGKAHEVQGLDDGLAAKVWHGSQSDDQRKSSTARMAKDQKDQLAEGYEENIDRNVFDEEKNFEFKLNKAKLTGDLQEAFGDAGGAINPFNIDQVAEIHKAVGKIDHRFINKLDTSTPKGLENLKLIGNHIEEGTLKRLEIKEMPDDNILTMLREIKNNRVGTPVHTYVSNVNNAKYVDFYRRA